MGRQREKIGNVGGRWGGVLLVVVVVWLCLSHLKMQFCEHWCALKSHLHPWVVTLSARTVFLQNSCQNGSCWIGKYLREIFKHRLQTLLRITKNPEVVAACWRPAWCLCRCSQECIWRKELLCSFTWVAEFHVYYKFLCLNYLVHIIFFSMWGQPLYWSLPNHISAGIQITASHQCFRLSTSPISWWYLTCYCTSYLFTCSTVVPCPFYLC